MNRKYFQARTLVNLPVLFSLICSGPSLAEEIRYHPPNWKQQLQSGFEKQGKDYLPRTKNLLEDGRPAYINRLILEDSPYLVQHAHNPVNWYPWGAQAFAIAKQENKAVFLSIGYSTCHWCHVMEEESFDNLEIAKLLNEHFISIKVDRERRPDVDAVYMAAVQLIAGGGGWPMSSFLTPDGKTFLGGTYFTPDHFKHLLIRVSELWKTQQAMLIAQAEQVASAVARENKVSRKAQKIDDDVVRNALSAILKRHDLVHGGFGNAPKFPNEAWLLFLLDAARRDGNRNASNAVESSLQAMARGGIYDQVGGGFHRYSTDDRWLAPHFEKMLYNQALLARAYLYTYQLTGESLYERIARQTLDFVLDDMTAPDGGFYSAFDADSEEGEGAYFLWTRDQLKQVLPQELAALAITLYGVGEQGNFAGKNILHLPVSLADYARQNEIPFALVYQKIDRVRAELEKARRKRRPPFRDDKIITSWNAMMIHTLAIASEILEQPEYLSAAERAANLVWQKNRRDSGRLWRLHLNGRSSIQAGLDDYAFLADAFLELADVSAKPEWLGRARTLAGLMLDDFRDDKEGGFFMNVVNPDNPVMVRPKDMRDGSTPSASATALRVLVRLSKRVPDAEYTRQAAAALAAFSNRIVQSPAEYSSMLVAANELKKGEPGPHQYAAKGAVSLRASSSLKAQNSRLKIDISIRPGWHINAHQPLQDYLIPTSISLTGDSGGWKLGEIHYPSPLQKKLGFQKQILALYEGSVRLEAELIKPAHGSITMLPVQIKLQACNDKVCLAPENLNFQVPLF